MAKPVGPLCNLECSYCYYLNTEGSKSKHPQLQMSDDVLEEFIKQMIQTNPGPVVSFTWHGGEPTLAGLDFYRKAVALQKEYLPKNWTCWNNLQTNGINLDDEWCSFLAKEHFDVGISIDGTQTLHDHFRKDKKGQGSYHRVVESIHRLKKAGILPDLLCTVNSLTTKDPLGVYRTLRELNTGWIQFIPILIKNSDGTLASDSVDAKAYGEFLKVIFEEWIHHDLGVVDVQIFAETAIMWAGGSASVCWLAPTCGRVMVVERNGNVYSCDHYVSSQYYLGNIENSSLADLVDSPFQKQFGQNKREHIAQKCLSCPYLKVCNGGCPKDRIDHGDLKGLNILCEGLYAFHEHAEKPLKELMRLRMQGLSPQEIMKQLRLKFPKST